MGDQGFVDELDAHLRGARTQLVAGDSAGAAGSLAEFLGLVEAARPGAATGEDSGDDGDDEEDGDDDEDDENSSGAQGTLTSEGYGLLFFNGRYLLERLPEPVLPDEEEDDEEDDDDG